MTEAQIIEGLIQKSNAVVILLYNRFAPRILGHVLSNQGTKEDVNELFQQVIFKILIILERGTYKQEGLFEAFFFRIVRNTWVDILRREKKHKKFSDTLILENEIVENEMEVFFQYVQEHKKSVALNRAIHKLPDPQREIILWRYQDGLTSLAIAGRLGILQNTLNQRMLHARETLRTLAKIELARLTDDFGSEILNNNIP